jgi:hypothetical protein
MSFLLSHVFSSTKLEKRTEQVLLGREEDGGRGRGQGAGRRDGSNNVYIYE